MRHRLGDIDWWDDPFGYGADDAAAPAAAASAAAPPVFTTSQIVQQLRTSWGGALEGTTESWAGTGPINYYIGGVPFPSGSSEILSWVPMTALMVNRATLAFELWDDLIARDLTPTSIPGSGQIQFEYASQTYGGGTYSRSMLSSGGGTNSYGTANYNITREEIWLNSTWSTHDQDADMYFGGYGFETYMHEIGHSLGLSHPGTYDAVGGTTITYANSAEFAQDNRQYTIMSYFGGYQLGSGWQQDGTYSDWYYSETPMLDDIAAIQAIYGADTTTRLGNTTYGFNNNSGRDVYDFNIDTHPIFAVWDAGGNDTLDASGYAVAQRIDLRAGTYSDIGGMVNNIAIAFGVTIENAVGGSGNDTITGNDADNTIRPGRGNDTIDGGLGTDTVVFAGVRAAYTITDLGGSSARVVGPDGTDTLTNVELFQFDNQTVGWPPPRPDLDALNLAFSSTSLHLNVATTVSYTLSNLGSAASPASTVGFYQSADNVFDASDVLVATRPIGALAAGASINDSFALTLTNEGSYFIIAVADYSGAIVEGSETNNASNAVQVTVSANHAPVITSDGGGDAATIGIDENTSAVTRVTASDQDAGTTFSYAIIGGADQALFQVGASGALSFRAAPDYENPADSDHNNSYVVQVRVSDNGSPILSDIQTITVTVKDVAPQIVGDDTDNILVGTAENDTILGLGGNDRLSGLAGNDTLDGGDGADTAVYGGNRANYSITFDTSTFNFTVVDQRTGTPDGRDTVHGVTSFEFADGTVDAMSLTTRTVNNSDGTRTATVYDAPDSVPWTSHASTYDGANHLLSEVFNEDNGTRWANTFDPNNATVWTTQNFDGAGMLISQVQASADGTHRLSAHDTANAGSWLDFTIAFDADWNMTSETGTHDNGTPLTTSEISMAYDNVLWFTHPVDPARDFHI